MAAEFEYYLNAAGVVPAAAPVPEPLEDMSTEISLLDGLDGSCSQVHLDGVQFSDHIIVTNTENGLIFTGSGCGVIEGMDDVDVDMGIDQSSQNQMVGASFPFELSLCFPSGIIFCHFPPFFQVCQIFSTSELPDSLLAGATVTTTETGQNAQAESELSTFHIVTDAMLSNANSNSNLASVSVDENTQILAGLEAASTSVLTNTNASASAVDVTTTATALETEANLLHTQFERWLAGVNERINASMNYRLSGAPEPFVYYVCQVNPP